MGSPSNPAEEALRRKIQEQLTAAKAEPTAELKTTAFLTEQAGSIFDPDLLEGIFWLRLNRLNAKCEHPLSRTKARSLSVELFEKLSGEKVPVYPGMFENDDQPNSDVGFGKIFAREFGDLVRYNPETQEWLLYTRGVWRVDPDRVQVRQLLKNFFLIEYDTAQLTLEDLRPAYEPISHFFFAKSGEVKAEHAGDVTEEQKALAKLWHRTTKERDYAADGQSVKRLMSAIEMAKTEDLARTAWDANPLLLNLPNATIDLATGEPLGWRRKAFGTMQGGVNFDDGAACPRFEETLARSLPDEAVRLFLQDFLGLSLSGLMTPEILIFLGEGANGKGLLLRIIASIMGDYYRKASMSSFLTSKFVNPGGARSDLAALRGKRLVTAAEANRKVAIDMELLKDWTGGEDFDARDVYEKSKKTSKPQAKLIFSMNKPPRIQDQTHAAWRRLRYINFNVVIPESERNEHLADELLAAEGPGILNWVLDGWWRVRDRIAAKKPALVTPKIVMDATLVYKENESQVARFFEDEFEVKLEYQVKSTDLYARYKGWCNRNGEFSTSSQQLIMELVRYCSERGIKTDWGGHNHHPGIHRGLRLRAVSLEAGDQEEMGF